MKSRRFNLFCRLTTSLTCASISDEDGGEDRGEKEEILQISQLDEMKAVWLFCWDYGMVQTQCH